MGDGDGDAMCLDVKLQTVVRPSVALSLAPPNGCNRGGGGGTMCSTQALVPSLCSQQDVS